MMPMILEVLEKEEEEEEQIYPEKSMQQMVLMRKRLNRYHLKQIHSLLDDRAKIQIVHQEKKWTRAELGQKMMHQDQKKVSQLKVSQRS